MDRKEMDRIQREENPFTPRCRNCGQILRSPASITRGFGPTCAIVFAEKWMHAHPTSVGDRVKRKWSREEIKQIFKVWRPS
jgi:hypothetical protein